MVNRPPFVSRSLFVVPVIAALVSTALGTRALLSSLRSERPAGELYRDRFAVASESATATRVGMEALRAGANAVDAAITVALTLGVVEPESSGIGGGGFALVWDAAQRKVTALDFRETAPRGIDPAALEDRPKTPVEKGRGRMIGVPGEVAGLLELHRRFGTRSLAEDAAPAIALAENGYYTSNHLAQLALAYHDQLEWSRRLYTLFRPDDWCVGIGRKIKNPDLGGTLRRIAAEGRRGFYQGKVASEIVEAAQAAGSPMTDRDLSTYAPVEREPLTVGWEGYKVFTMPPPSAGGLMLAETLGMFGKADLQALGLGSGGYVHLLAETFRGAVADRMRSIGDPAFVKTDVAALTEKMRLLDRRGHIALDRTHPASRFVLKEHGTTHLVVVDGEGNVVSLTSTVNNGFGAFVSTETSGVLLNDELADFTTRAQAQPFGESPNVPRPLARPTSSMTPTIVLRDGLPELALGGSGGLRIATGVTEAFLARTVFGLSPMQSVSATRFHTPTDYTPPNGPVLELEYGASDAIVRDLRSRGETVQLVDDYSGVHMVSFDRGPGGALHMSAAADPRKRGAAAVE
jgi:gamma-glutamyltranspeptidase/glutathione hydrolase